MRKAFTLIEIVIVLLVIGVLMAATMRFGSNRIVDLKAQSFKEQFVGRYNDLYSQNLTSSFRDGVKYKTLTVTFQSGVRYQVDQGPFVLAPNADVLVFRNILIDGNAVHSADLRFTPYILGCEFSGTLLTFEAFVPENGSQYCFEIPSETCKLIEIRCTD